MRNPTHLTSGLLPYFLLVSCAAAAADPAIRRTDVFQRLKAQIDQIRLVDTHEHLPSEAGRLKQPADFLAVMLHYVEADLVSAGMARSEKNHWQAMAQDGSLPFEQRWAEFAKYWPEARLTGYGRALELCARDLYGVGLDDMSLSTGTRLNQRMAQSLKPGFYKWVLKDKARIDLSIVDGGNPQEDREFFMRVRRFDDFVMVSSSEQLDQFARRAGQPVDSLEGLVKALETAIDQAKRDGVIGLKSGLAYGRRIYYPMPPVDMARAAFAKVKAGVPARPEESLSLQNYMMNQIARLAGERGLPVQIHTGLQTGFGNDITRSKPTDLVNLAMEYPKTKFILFHGSYPYGPELATMAKNFANVYIDMCWLHIISPKVAREYLSEWIETVPANKIMGFGGDYLFVEGAYAHAEMARENVAHVLAQKVLDGYCSEADALGLARKILRQNAVTLFGLKLD